MDVWELSVFIAVLDAGSVSDASRKVHRTQPQVSRIIKDLESEIGFALFNRSGQRLLPTARGLEFAETARRLLSEMSRVRSEARQLRAKDRDWLHIVAPSYAYYGFLPRALVHLKKAMPDTRFRLSIPPRAEDLSYQMDRAFDCGLGRLPSHFANCREIELAGISPALLVPKGHPLAELTVAWARDIADTPFIGLPPDASFRRRLEISFREEGVEPDIVATAPDMMAALRLVVEGIGVTVGDPLAAIALAPGSVDIVPFAPIPPGAFGVFFHEESQHAPVRKAFTDAVLAGLAECDPRFVRLVR